MRDEVKMTKDGKAVRGSMAIDSVEVVSKGKYVV